MCCFPENGPPVLRIEISKAARARTAGRTWSARSWKRQQRLPAILWTSASGTWKHRSRISGSVLNWARRRKRMQPFSKHTGLVLPIDRVNVDTDQMVPKQFLKLQNKQGLGRVLFYDWRYLPGEKPNSAFILNWPRYKRASVMLARANFGCGSSREHAPWAVADYGFRVLIAPSFADIFYNNCFKNAILPVTLPEAQIDELFRRAETREGYSITADLPNQTISDATGLNFKFEIDPFRKHVLLEGLDDIGLTLKYVANIAEYEQAKHPSATLHGTVDAKYFP